MNKTKNLLNLVSLTIGTATFLYIFGYDFLISKTPKGRRKPRGSKVLTTSVGGVK